MKKFNTQVKITKKQRLLIFIAFLVTSFPLITIMDWLSESEIYYISNGIQSLLSAAFMSFILPLTFKHLAKKLEKSITFTLDEDEVIQVESPAGQKIKGIVYGGKLILTNKRFLFVRHGFFQKKKIWKLNRDQVQHIKPIKLFKLVDNGLEIMDKSDNTYHFNSQKRNEVLAALQAEIK